MVGPRHFLRKLLCATLPQYIVVFSLDTTALSRHNPRHLVALSPRVPGLVPHALGRRPPGELRRWFYRRPPVACGHSA